MVYVGVRKAKCRVDVDLRRLVKSISLTAFKRLAAPSKERPHRAFDYSLQTAISIANLRSWPFIASFANRRGPKSSYKSEV